MTEKIDEKRLDALLNLYWSGSEEWRLEMQAIIRLARLGLWAESHGAPIVEIGEKVCQILSDWNSAFPEGLEINGIWMKPYELRTKFEEALSHLPKEEK